MHSAFVFRNVYSQNKTFSTYRHFLFRMKMSALDSVEKNVRPHDITSYVVGKLTELLVKLTLLRQVQTCKRLQIVYQIP